ncbi:MAG: glycosyltransferase family 2 protein, partial [Elusimicrobiota bacterium]|nr:glycosyltransferase family 2 protein [Elusimicrobiota bacterium]
MIVPIFNAQEYLSACLDSLINQTFNEIEILCVNDGSTDSSLEIL